MIPRFHVPFLLAPGATVDLPTEAAHHALKVLRVGAGDTALLFDGRGGEWLATLQPAGKGLRAVLREYFDINREPSVQVNLVQCLAAADKMDFVVQKAVELGVARIQPVAAKRSVIRLSGERMERRVTHWANIASAACEQSGRNRVPEVAPILDLPQYLAAATAHNDLRLICLAPSAEVQCLRLRDLPRPEKPVTLLIGPEGGFEEGEIKAAQFAGFQAVNLGPRVLRTETAGPAALAAIMALWGDL
jgi:16S rRNA (uracil1498-N3)-methyltransferase